MPRALRVPFVFKTRQLISSLLFRSISITMSGQMLSTVELAKKRAAFQAVDEHVKDGMVLGIGSGSTIVYAVDRIVEKVKEDNLKIMCIPTSFQSQMLIVKNKLLLKTMDECPVIDCVIDGADEVDQNFNLIKGGGACQTQEKIVAFNSKKIIIIADYTKNSIKLGDTYKKGVPIEVIPFARGPVEKKIVSCLGGKTELRMGKMKAGPVITDNGNLVIDWKFPEDISDWETVNKQIKMLPGVVETGLFCNMADTVYFGMEDGSVKVVQSK